MHKFIAGHNHTSHPEEEDVRSGDQVVGRVIVLQVGVAGLFGVSGFLRVEHADGPEPTGEPGIEHVFVLDEVGGLNRGVERPGGLQGLFRSAFHHIAAVGQVVSGNALSPPELTGDAPVADIFHPVFVGVAVFVGNEFDFSAFHAFEGILGQGVHFQEPLGGEFGLDDGVAALGITDGGDVVHGLFEVAGFFEHLGNFFAGDEAVFSNQDLGLFIEPAVVVDDVEHGQVVAQADFVVVHVVGGGHFQAARSEVHFDISVFNDGNFLVNQRNQDFLSFQPVVAFVRRVDADSGIRHNGLGAGGGDDDVLVGRVALSVRDEIAHMVELAGGVLVLDLFVADGGQAHGIPVNHTDALVDISFLVEINEGVDDGFAQVRVHRKLGAVPVATGAEFAELVQDDAAVFFLPFPGVLEELLTGEVFLADALGFQFGDDFVLGGDAGVVGSGHPAGVLAVHPCLADEHIIERVVEHVAHMQNTRDIGRGNHNRIGGSPIGLRMKKFVLQPVGVPFVLHFRRVVILRLRIHLSQK